MQTLDEIIARWNSNEGKPYKGNLIDWTAYDGDGETAPPNIGCMCAQGQVLHLLGGWSPIKLKNTDQRKADVETARLLNISITHAILLRNINDSVDGAPSIVLTDPEKILGDQAHIILAFWKHIDRMTAKDWNAARDATWDTTWDATWEAAKDAAKDAAWEAVWDAGRIAAWIAAWNATWDAGRIAAWACMEIQGAMFMRERGHPFFFLPLFGFADPSEIPLS